MRAKEEDGGMREWGTKAWVSYWTEEEKAISSSRKTEKKIDWRREKEIQLTYTAFY